MIPKIPGLDFGGASLGSSDQNSNTANAGSSAKGSMLNFAFDSGVNFAPKNAPAWQWIAGAVAVAVVGMVALRAMRKKRR